MKISSYIKNIGLCLLLSVIITSCGSKKKTTSKKRNQTTQQIQKPRPKVDKPHLNVSDYENMTVDPKKDVSGFESPVEKYIYTYAEIAMEEMRLYHVPASITLAQGILESSSGNGDLTRRSNNHFGIKCNGWQGEKVYHDDDAYQECFRKYINPKYSFRDHSLFLAKRKRYASLFELDKDDYKGWAKGLKRAGYATDPRYPNKLISLIERYNLQEYDNIVLGEGSRKGSRTKPHKSKPNYNSTPYVVEKGDTLYNISRRFDISVEELKQINNLKSNSLSIGQKLYIKKQ
ncbi:flagellum-specific peptidoglycan hydrolase FlgJ [Mesonia hippocampi]|uniref:Peptidoglycan hydrolase n=1 Tax=Mesonia hippocampi TaxID=1628250 RepID=A0A840EKM8_9FLAO|nr:glucosaminidase domain-containing protein [Mesonia hippocampi]MBB4118698.1 flagellum-specific peptidoglycan hydrolase FlgJ [Mesonia hippocampi]